MELDLGLEGKVHIHLVPEWIIEFSGGLRAKYGDTQKE